jgi:hypothetical protein
VGSLSSLPWLALSQRRSPIAPQDRADGPEKNADKEEGRGNKSVIVIVGFLGEEKSLSRQRQDRDRIRKSSYQRNGGIAIDDMRMAAHDPRKHPANNFNVLPGEY